MTNGKMFVYSFYRFKKIKNIKYFKNKIKNLNIHNKIYGTVLIASEGINGSISGQKKEIDNFLINIKKLLKIRKISLKKNKTNFIPFYRLKIRLKNEIVTIGNQNINPEKKRGKFIDPKNWDKIISNKEYFIIDTRNKYEIDIGSFKNSINPQTQSFRDFPKFITSSGISKNQKIAMFCTGGIRCEKASSLLIDSGYKDVSQLDGGILNYLKFKKNKKKSSWNGECFVFDNRVSVNKNLEKGSYDQCYGCRRPITNKDKKLPSYKKGATCKHCISLKSNKRIRSSLERQKQIDDAELEKKPHSFMKICL